MGDSPIERCGGGHIPAGYKGVTYETRGGFHGSPAQFGHSFGREGAEVGLNTRLQLSEEALRAIREATRNEPRYKTDL